MGTLKGKCALFSASLSCCLFIENDGNVDCDIIIATIFVGQQASTAAGDGGIRIGSLFSNDIQCLVG